MAADNVTPLFPGVNEPRGEDQDDTAPRIRAYLRSMRLMGQPVPDEEEAYVLGRELIERIANSSRGFEEPSLRLTGQECAAVLAFMTWVEPRNMDGWWRDPHGTPSHVVGFYLVLQALRRSLEGMHEVQQ